MLSKTTLVQLSPTTDDKKHKSDGLPLHVSGGRGNMSLVWRLEARGSKPTSRHRSIFSVRVWNVNR